MEISKAQFERWVKEALDDLPKKYLDHMNNVVIFVADYPTADQNRKLRLRSGSVLFGLYEGYHQAKRLNVGLVLPDRITIFQKTITDYHNNEEAIKEQIKNTIQHEIAHHFGSGEEGARKAGRRKI